MNKACINIIFIFLFISSVTQSGCFADPLDVVIRQLEEMIKDPKKITFDHQDKRNLRTPEKQKKVLLYVNQIGTLRVVILRSAHQLIVKKLKKENTGIIRSPVLDIHEIKDAFVSLKTNGGDLRTGDILFYTPSGIESDMIADSMESDYSHCGLVWVRKDKPYIIQVAPRADLLILPMEDVLVPRSIPVMRIGIFRYKGKLDEMEMEYLLTLVDKQKEAIIFDDYFIPNPLIKTPENYFQENPFLFCTEFPYLLYAFVLGRTDFLSPYQGSLAKAIHRVHNLSGLSFAIIDKIDEVENSAMGYIVTPNNFTQSQEFEPILTLKARPNDQNINSEQN
ncbi:MAG: hypothetical protein JW774_01450 [Candidatus Aureabacteria bacterium]|nr:hypothetical protein [Candidatus Auribacterota bacterium]